MTSKQWLQKMFGRGKSRQALRPRFVPRLDVLEDRLAPAVLMVTTLSDDVVAGSGLSLREAVKAVVTRTSVDGSPVGTGGDVIRFDPSLDGGTISLHSAPASTIAGPSAFSIPNDTTLVID